MTSERDLRKTEKELLRESLAFYRISKRKGFFQDARETLLQARPYRMWQMLLGYVRRFRTIAFAARVIGWIVTILQTGALVLLTTALFFVILPLLGALLAGTLLVALLDLHRSKKRLRSALNGRNVYVFFGLRGEIGVETAREISGWENCAVLVVSGYWLSPKGMGNGRFYVNARQEGEHLFLVRRYFFYSIRKILPPGSTAFIY